MNIRARHAAEFRNEADVAAGDAPPRRGPPSGCMHMLSREQALDRPWLLLHVRTRRSKIATPPRKAHEHKPSSPRLEVAQCHDCIVRSRGSVMRQSYLASRQRNVYRPQTAATACRANRRFDSVRLGRRLRVSATARASVV
eukprot:SAG22_NODE_337_length_12043_cov_58.339556_12_plen_141_part_00